MNLEELIAGLDESELDNLMAQIEETKKAEQREKAQSSFMEYVKVMWPGFVHGRHHALMAKKFEDVVSGKIKRLIINLPPRHAISTSMTIPTLEGMKTVANLAVGDYVFGSDGKPTLVLGKSEVFKNRQLYSVTTNDGFSLVVDGEHLWTVRLDRKAKKFFDYTTEQLWERQNGAMFRASRKTKVIQRQNKLCDPLKVRMPMLPSMAAVERPEENLLVDPYVLGVWLGDGTKNQAVITSIDSDAEFIRPEIELRGYKTTDQSTKYSFGILDLKVKLRELGVLGNKHIPKQYLNASIKQRRDLLKGLMDTDGNVSKKGQCFFSQSKKNLIDQVRMLLASLGIKNSVNVSEAKIGNKSYGDAWRITFYAHDVFILPRKECRTLKTERCFGRYIKIQKLIETGNTQCIKVDRDDGLFMAGEGHIITHNTKSEFASYLLPSWFLGKFPDKKVIQASNTADLAVGFGRKVRNLVGSEAYSKIFPGVALRQDSKAAGRWATSSNGDYFAIGVGGTVTGKGADLLIIDDPHALATDTLVPTPLGFRTIAELRVGDEVFGVDGFPTRVVAKSDVWPERELFKVDTNDGETVYCDGGHLWNYRKDTKLRAPHKNSTARELAEWNKTSLPCMQRHGVVQYPNTLLPIDPYVLGAWLGDGTSSMGRMTSHPTDMPFMRGQFEASGHATTTLKDTYSFGVTMLAPKLRALGVLNNKHIPEIYLLASPAQRLALLQGLMDTDGTVTTVGQCSFQNTNRKLAQGVRELLQSLGLKAKMCVYFDTRELHATRKPDYRVNFKLADSFRMPRKNIRTFTATDKQCRFFTVSKTELRGDVQCITVDRKDGLFLVGRGYVVTHNSEQEARLAASDSSVFDSVYEWYTSGPRQRLQPNGSIIVVQTRWGDRDLCGRIMAESIKRNKSEEWEIIELPAIMPSGQPLWPEFWSLKELEDLKAELPISKWNAQYQQQPTGEEGAIVKREWWKRWTKEKAPKCEYIIQSWDTAYTKGERSDYSACTTWGVFYLNDDSNQPNIILLDALKKRMEFPELKEVAHSYYKEWEPDTCVIEAKAAGAPLIFELRAMGMFIESYTPTRGNDKFVRINAVSDLFSSGVVWAPETRWAEEVIEEMAAFPNAPHDDLVDSSTQALLRFRKGGFIRLDSDEKEDIKLYKKTRAYY